MNNLFLLSITTALKAAIDTTLKMSILLHTSYYNYYVQCMSSNICAKTISPATNSETNLLTAYKIFESA